MNDGELLRRYAQEGSEEAFAEFVALRIGIVYSAALRQTGGDARRAEDVTQAVFTDLARKAGSLWRHRTLIGWLYTGTRYAVLKMARDERRRRDREQEAHTMNEILAPASPDIPPERLRALLDEAMHQLTEDDRHALLLRFFDGLALADVGRSLGLSESAAQKRVERALARLKDVLATRGLASTAAALAAALGQEAAAAVLPSGLAAAVSGNAMAGASAAGAGIISFLSMPVVISAAASALILASVLGIATYVGRGARTNSPNVGAAVAASRLGPAALARPFGDEREAEEADPASAGALPSTGRSRPPPVSAAGPPPAALRPSLEPAAPAADAIFSPAPPSDLVAGLRVLDPSQLDRRPVPVSKLRPNYPAEMRRRNLSGKVIVDFTVDATGRVRDAVAVSSSRIEFERAAVAAVTHWRFIPGRSGVRPVETHMQVPILFNLDSHD